jgi:hypothetical protein
MATQERGVADAAHSLTDDALVSAFVVLMTKIGPTTHLRKSSQVT